MNDATDEVGAEDVHLVVQRGLQLAVRLRRRRRARTGAVGSLGLLALLAAGWSASGGDPGPTTVRLAASPSEAVGATSASGYPPLPPPVLGPPSVTTSPSPSSTVPSGPGSPSTTAGGRQSDPATTSAPSLLRTSSANPSASIRPTTATASTSVPDACRMAQLAARTHDGSVGGSNVDFLLSFDNTSASACTLSGFPRLYVDEPNGSRTEARDEGPDHGRVLLLPGRSAVVQVHYYSTSPSGDYCPSSGTHVTVPGDPATRDLSDTYPCAGLSVTSFKAEG